jgi:D-glycero-D-manno-heptose 1,7-bisphosphate phosphatase
MVGDGENDVKAGKNAGCRTAFIKREEVDVDADVTVDSLLEFVEQHWDISH